MSILAHTKMWTVFSNEDNCQRSPRAFIDILMNNTLTCSICSGKHAIQYFDEVKGMWRKSMLYQHEIFRFLPYPMAYRGTCSLFDQNSETTIQNIMRCKWWVNSMGYLIVMSFNHVEKAWMSNGPGYSPKWSNLHYCWK